MSQHKEQYYTSVQGPDLLAINIFAPYYTFNFTEGRLFFANSLRPGKAAKILEQKIQYLNLDDEIKCLLQIF